MAGDVQFQLFAPQLRNAAGRFRDADPHSALDRLILTWAQTALANLREATPVEEGAPLQRGHPPPGTARAAWRVDHVPSRNEVKVTNTARDERGTAYLRFLVSGTGQDTGGYIYPKVAPFLVFYAKEGPSAGRLINRKRVRGIQPNPQLVAAIERLGPTAATMLHETGIKILQKIAGLGA